MRKVSEDIDKRYLEAIRAQMGERNASLFLYNCKHYYFLNIPLTGKRILDIGGGTGRFSFYAAAAGAFEAVCLEPEAAGSSEGMTKEFMRWKALLGFENVILSTQKIEEFLKENKFDILFSCASINHIDEEACIALRREQWAWDRYVSVFKHFRNLLNKRGYLIIIDASTPCFYSLLGLKNPFARTIDWRKHQPPSVWAKLASEVGFNHIITRWRSPAKMGSVGHFLLGNQWANFFLYNQFSMLLQLD